MKTAGLMTLGAGRGRPSLAGLPGLAGWWPFFDPDQRTISTGVSQANDISGNGRHVTQATGANQPTVASAYANGRDALSFDGSNDTLAASVSLDLSAGFTMAVAMRCNAANGPNQWVMTSGVAWTYLESRATPLMRTELYNTAGGLVASSTFDPTALHINIVTYNGATGAMTMEANGAQIASGTSDAGGFTTAGLAFGAWGTTDLGGPFGHSVCHIGEAALHLGAPSAFTSSWLRKHFRRNWKTF